MQKYQVDEILSAITRLSLAAELELPRAKTKLAQYLGCAGAARAAPEEFTAEGIWEIASGAERAYSQLRDLNSIERDLVPLLEKIARRIGESEERERQFRQWSHGVVAHCLNGKEVWVYAGTLTECAKWLESYQDDETPEVYSIRPMSILHAGQIRAAKKARREHEYSLGDIPF